MAAQELNDFSLDYTRDGSTVVLRVDGEVDCATAPALHQALRGVIEEQGNLFVRLDLAGMTFIDSSGLTTLVNALKVVRERGGDLTLTNPQPSARRVFDIVGFTQVFQMAPEDQDETSSSV